MRRTFLIVFTSLPLLLLASNADAQSCGAQTSVAEGESLADVADRCGTNLSAIFDANPDLRSTEVPPGTEIDISGGSVLNRAGDRLKEIGRNIQGAAERAGQSVSEYLEGNPDLNRDILEWGEWMGLPGVSPQPNVGAELFVSPAAGRPGDEVTIRAAGLRGETEVRIGAGPPESEYRTLSKARTTREGALEETIEVPEWAANQDTLVFVIETDRTRLLSEGFIVNRR
jgi:hypothetical protein